TSILGTGCSPYLQGQGINSELGLYSGDHAHDVGLLHDQEFLAVDLDLGPRPFAEQHAVAALEIDRDQLASLVATAGPNGDNLAFLRLLLGGVGDDDTALGLLLGVDTLHDHAVVQWTKLGLGHNLPRVGAPAKPLIGKIDRTSISTRYWRVPTAG